MTDPKLTPERIAEIKRLATGGTYEQGFVKYDPRFWKFELPELCARASLTQVAPPTAQKGECICIKRGWGPEGCGICNETGNAHHAPSPTVQGEQYHSWDCACDHPELHPALPDVGLVAELKEAANSLIDYKWTHLFHRAATALETVARERDEAVKALAYCATRAGVYQLKDQLAEATALKNKLLAGLKQCRRYMDGDVHADPAVVALIESLITEAGD